MAFTLEKDKSSKGIVKRRKISVICLLVVKKYLMALNWFYTWVKLKSGQQLKDEAIKCCHHKRSRICTNLASFRWLVPIRSPVFFLDNSKVIRDHYSRVTLSQGKLKAQEHSLKLEIWGHCWLNYQEGEAVYTQMLLRTGCHWKPSTQAR